MSLVLLLFLAFRSSLLVLRLRGRHALFPPEGEQEKGEKRELLRHSGRRLAPGRTRWDSDGRDAPRRVLAVLAGCLPAALAASPGTAPAAPLYGLTIDRITNPDPHRRGARGAAATADHPRVLRTAPAGLVLPAALTQIHAVSAVMGELLDSSDEKSLSTEAFQAHVQEYLERSRASIDIWEIGNEVNGNWTGPYETVAAKLAVAYRTSPPRAGRRALTLYENDFGPEHCGDGDAEPTPVQFTERYVPAEVADGLDYVLLSYYPTQCGGRMPSSPEVALAAAKPYTRSTRTRELGFGEVGLPHPRLQAHRRRGRGDHALGLLARPRPALLRGRLLLVVRLPGRAEAEGAAGRRSPAAFEADTKRRARAIAPSRSTVPERRNRTPPRSAEP